MTVLLSSPVEVATSPTIRVVRISFPAPAYITAMETPPTDCAVAILWTDDDDANEAQLLSAAQTISEYLRRQKPNFGA